MPKIVATNHQKKKLDKLSKRLDEASTRAKVGLEHAQRALPIMNASREEQQHALSLINGIVDKLLDTAKLLVSISFPALVTLYSLKSDSFNPGRFISLTFIVLASGLLLFFFGMRYKLNHLTPYVEASAARLSVYTECMNTVLLNAKNEELKIEHKKISKTSQSRDK